MNAKERFYSEIARETINRITSNKEEWTSFLITMGNNYDFTYPEQVMIYAQRPKAVLCKEYEEWNNKDFRRYVRRGSRGIALFATDIGRPYLRYVFEVADTGRRRTAPEMEPWRVKPEYRESIQASIERDFGVKSGTMLERQLEEAALHLASDYWDDYKNQLLDIVENSYLEEYDEYNIEVSFKTAVAVSVSYAIYTRFDLNPDEYFDHEDFRSVFDFNTRQTVNMLGTAVNSISTRMLTEIEKAITAYEQEKQAERSQSYEERVDLQPEWRLSDSRFETGAYGDEVSGQIRENAESISAGEQPDDAERFDFDGAVVSAPAGNRRDSEPQSITAGEPVPAGRSGTGKGNQSDGLGTAHERIEGTGGGSSDEGAYQQLTLNLFPSEEEQIYKIDEAESRRFSAFSFPQEIIDHALLLGSNTDKGRMLVVNEFAKQKPVEEIVEILQKIYHGGYGLKENGTHISCWYGEDGIHLASGRSSRYTKSAQVIPWEDAAKRISQLLEDGSFATNVELVEAHGYERKLLAQSIWYLYHDMTEEARGRGFLPSLRDVRELKAGFPDETQHLADLLSDRNFCSVFKAEFAEFLEAYHSGESVLRFRSHRPDHIYQMLSEQEIPRKEYYSEMMDVPVVGSFITDDEISADLSEEAALPVVKPVSLNIFRKIIRRKKRQTF